MNIDLLQTSSGDFGLVGDRKFKSPVAGVIYDIDAQLMSLEYTDMSAQEMNISVEERFIESLSYAVSIHIGTIEGSKVQDNRQVPLMLLNDSSKGVSSGIVQPTSSVESFEYFLKNCVSGQPIHREDLGNEATIDGIMAGTNPALIEFAPHLVKQKSLQATPKIAPSAPGLGPPGNTLSSGPSYRPKKKSSDES